jgi:hypothetical protein
MSKKFNEFISRKYLIFQQANSGFDRLYAIRKEHFKRIHLLEKEYGSLRQIPSKEIIDCHELIFNEKASEYMLKQNKMVITPINRLEHQEDTNDI